jgi:hypothetical protein
MRAIAGVLAAAIVIGCQSEPVERFGVVRSAADEEKKPRSCDGDRFPMHVGAGIARECCQLGDETWHISPRAPGGISHRIYGLPCREADGIGTACSGMQCSYGPCGGFNLPLIGAAPALIFHPGSDPSVCGYQYTLPGGVVTSWPEPYSGQPLYADVVASCPFTTCLVGGVPATTLTVTSDASAASGALSTNPEGIAFAGGGSAKWNFADVHVHLKARPSGPHVRAVFGGDCDQVGDYGEDAVCNLRLGPDKSVTVRYECEDGYSCL